MAKKAKAIVCCVERTTLMKTQSPTLKPEHRKNKSVFRVPQISRK